MSCTIISDCAACTREYHHTSKALSQGPAVRRQFLRDALASAGTPREKDARGVPPGQVRTAARAAKPQPLRRVARARRSPTNLGSWRPRSRPLVLPDRPASARSGPTRLHLHMLRRRPRALLGVGARCGSDERVAARFRRRNSTGLRPLEAFMAVAAGRSAAPRALAVPTARAAESLLVGAGCSRRARRRRAARDRTCRARSRKPSLAARA